MGSVPSQLKCVYCGGKGSLKRRKKVKLGTSLALGRPSAAEVMVVTGPLSSSAGTFQENRQREETSDSPHSSLESLRGAQVGDERSGRKPVSHIKEPVQKPGRRPEAANSQGARTRERNSVTSRESHLGVSSASQTMALQTAISGTM